MSRLLVVIIFLMLAGCAHTQWVYPVNKQCPDEFRIKANINSGFYHTPSSKYYDLVRSKFKCFKTERDARDAGFRSADPRFRDVRLP